MAVVENAGAIIGSFETNVQTVNGDRNLNVVFNNNDIVSTTISVPNNNYQAQMAQMRNGFEENGVQTQQMVMNNGGYGINEIYNGVSEKWWRRQCGNANSDFAGSQDNNSETADLYNQSTSSSAATRGRREAGEGERIKDTNRLWSQQQMPSHRESPVSVRRLAASLQGPNLFPEQVPP
ncbi:hypothetical protein K1719_020323 [Acacia pycnantha]|nr:hypothetical protein K1719_020323 [Acacia pycnantha]